MYARVKASCAAGRPQHVPQDWTNDGFAQNNAGWEDFVPVVGENVAWELERSRHFLGTPVPILFNPYHLATIFKAGGLMFIFFEQADSISVLQPGISAPEAARAVNESRIEDLCVETATDEHLCSSESYRYFILWQWEKFAFGRNRWRELKARGGEVDPVWLNEVYCWQKKPPGGLSMRRGEQLTFRVQHSISFCVYHIPP